MTTITEIAPDIYRISTFDSNISSQFIQFLVKFVGDGKRALQDLAVMLREVLVKE